MNTTKLRNRIQGMRHKSAAGFTMVEVVIADVHAGQRNDCCSTNVCLRPGRQPQPLDAHKSGSCRQ